MIAWRRHRRSLRSVIAAGVMILLTLQNACYIYVPAASVTPAAGSNYKFVISDRGRVGFSDQLGAGVTSIEGKLVGENPDGYVVSVATVESMTGGPSHWTGERLTVNKGYVTTILERQLSKRRTAVAIGVASGAVVAFFVTRALIGGGSDSGSGETPPPPGSIIIRQ